MATDISKIRIDLTYIRNKLLVMQKRLNDRDYNHLAEKIYHCSCAVQEVIDQLEKVDDDD